MSTISVLAIGGSRGIAWVRVQEEWMRSGRVRLPKKLEPRAFVLAEDPLQEPIGLQIEEYRTERLGNFETHEQREVLVIEGMPPYEAQRQLFDWLITEFIRGKLDEGLGAQK